MAYRTPPKKFQHSLLALAIGAAFAPAWALDLADAPPGTVQPYVRPNVIISIDDSGSMDYRLDRENATNASNTKVPNSDGSWPVAARRMNVLKYALIGDTNASTGANTDGKGVFRDTSLLPTNKIRLSWQVMHNNGKSSGADNVNSDPSAGQNTNSMRIMDDTHRANFIEFVRKLSPSGGTPSHTMFSQADAYLRRGLHKNGPWASEPGETGVPYLGCRRNYHIFMTDGRWQTSPTSSNKIGGVNTNADNNKVNTKLPDGTFFGSTTNNAPIRAKTQLYADEHNNTLADWAFYSWSTPLQANYKGTNKNSTNTLYGTVEQDINYRKAAETENFGKDFNNKNAVLDRYWNPKYNPATWPHMVTYTIGFSAAAYTWPDFTQTNNDKSCKRADDSICAPTQMVPFGYDGSFPDLITGAVKWPSLSSSTSGKNSLDLWHAAINSRGRFYAVEKGEDLEKAFREIFQQINNENTGETTTSAISGTNTSRDNVGRYTSKYEPRDAWKGYVYSEILDRDGNLVDNPAWNGNTAAKLDARKADYASRLVLSWKSEDKTVSGRTLDHIKGEAISFAFNNLSTTQKSALNLNTASPAETDTRGSDRVDYVRGRTGHEGTTPTTFRQRVSIQGDIVNSAIWYTSWPNASLPLKGYADFAKAYDFRTPMLYVGGNDGMLHGFSALDGAEKIAYVPKGAIPSLRYLTGQDYNNKHKFFVDGSPMTGDVDIANTPNNDDSITHTPNWRTMLVGTMGLGGKGYFVLDVTNPGFSAKPARTGQTADTPVPSGKPASNFSATNAAQLVVMDRTRSPESGELACADNDDDCLAIRNEERDIGHITAEPVRHNNDILRATQITRMNNNRWAVVLGNGYNSFNQRPVLLVQYLDGNKELLRIPATTDTPGTGKANDNGLGAPRLVDLNGDDRMDIAYAGDNLGNLWKFDLTSYDTSEWGVAFSGTPLFTATGPAALDNPGRTLPQPITVAPTVRANDRMMTVGTGDDAKTVAVGGMMVAFGTGRNVARTDAENGNVQTLYSVLDNTRYRYRSSTPKRLEIHPGNSCSSGTANCVPVPAPAALGTGVDAANLVAQTINQITGQDYASLTTNKPLNLSNWAVKNGWYLDFPMVSERLLKPIDFYDGTNILTVYSQVPAKGADIDPNVETCDAGSVDEERQYRTFINIMDGAAPSVQLMTFAGIPASTILARTKVHKGAHSMITQGDKNMDIDTKDNVEVLNRMPETTSRPSWRQMQ